MRTSAVYAGKKVVGNAHGCPGSATPVAVPPQWGDHVRRSATCPRGRRAERDSTQGVQGDGGPGSGSGHRRLGCSGALWVAAATARDDGALCRTARRSRDTEAAE